MAQGCRLSPNFEPQTRIHPNSLGMFYKHLDGLNKKLVNVKSIFLGKFVSGQSGYRGAWGGSGRFRINKTGRERKTRRAFGWYFGSFEIPDAFGTTVRMFGATMLATTCCSPSSFFSPDSMIQKKIHEFLLFHFLRQILASFNRFKILFIIQPDDLVNWKLLASRFSELITEAPECLLRNSQNTNIETDRVRDTERDERERNESLATEEATRIQRLRELSLLYPIIRLAEQRNACTIFRSLNPSQ